MRDANEPTLKRLGKGAAVGAVVGLAGLLLAGLTFAPGVYTLGHAARFVGVAAAVCALGRLLCGGSVGPVLGLVAGFALGAMALPEPDPKPDPALDGQTAEVVGPTLDGKTFDVSELRGKVVLVDFWAVWCPPCRAEIDTHLKPLYDSTDRARFEIVGVSLDRKRATLEGYVREKEIAWPQLFFPEQEEGEPNPLAVKYEARFIPHTLLIGRDGKIAAAGLRGAELERAVKNLLDGGEISPREKPPVPPAAWWLAMVGGLLGAMIQVGTRARGSGPS